MTTGFIKEKKCYCCGVPNRYPETGAFVSYIGSRDLDSRFSETQRSSVYMLVQQCESCGYCNTDVAAGTPDAKLQVATEEYQKRLSNPGAPQTANAFLCLAMIQERAQNFAGACWSSIRAAWICDDNGSRKTAIEARKQAVTLIEKVRAQNKHLDSPIDERVLLVDLLRRSGQFEKASRLCELELELGPNEPIRSILEFEAGVIFEKDSKCHSFSEATRE